jgi:hypothetical protein
MLFARVVELWCAGMAPIGMPAVDGVPATCGPEFARTAGQHPHSDTMHAKVSRSSRPLRPVCGGPVLTARACRS